jgi:hypothetical protein
MATIPARQRARATNSPLFGLKLRTATGRRVRDLYQGLMAKLDLDNTIIRAAVRRAADLQVLSEQHRARMLNGESCDQETLVRLENMVARSMREVAELLAAMPKPPESHQAFIRRISNAQNPELFDEHDDCDRSETEEEDSAAT